MFGQGADGSAVRCGGGRFDEIEYDRQKKSVEWELESLLIPEVDAAKELSQNILAGEGVRLNFPLTPTLSQGRGGFEIVSKEAGRLLADLPRLWAGATLQERHQLLTTILDAVYIDLKDKKSIVSVKAKPAFQAVLGMATPNWDLSTTLAVR